MRWFVLYQLALKEALVVVKKHFVLGTDDKFGGFL